MLVGWGWGFEFGGYAVRVKIITGSLVILENYFPENYRYRYRLEIRMKYTEGVNREKLTVKKIINNEMFSFHRLCPLKTVKNST